MQNRSPDEPLRVLLTGAGSIARRHAQNLRDLVPAARFAFVCHSPASREWVGQFGGTAVDSVVAGAAGGVDLAVVCSESSQHGKDLGLLMSQVRALYVEKPVVIGRVALTAVRASVDAGWSRPNVVGCNLRYLGAVRKFKQAIDAGEAGPPALASLQVGQWLPDWRPSRVLEDTYSAHRERGGGVIFDLVHELDSAVYLFGEIAQGFAVAGNSGALAIDSDDAAAITLQMASGLPVQVSLDYISRMPVREYRVTGPRGTLRLDIVGKALEFHGPGGEVRTIETMPADWDMAGTYKLAMQDLLHAVRTGDPTHYDLARALHVTQWMIELEASAQRKAR